MRSIKFRVWSKKYNQWMNHCAVLATDGGILSFFFEVTKDDSGKVISSVPCVVPLSEEENVVQQSTGIKDCNNRDIYEGDIVKVKRCHTKHVEYDGGKRIEYIGVEDGEAIGLVFYSDHSCRFCVSFEHIRYDDVDDMTFVSHRYEVIGNEIENPGLIQIAKDN